MRSAPGNSYTMDDEELNAPVGANNNLRARNITRGIGSLTIQSIATSVLGFLFVFGLIRLLPPIQYGAYSAIQSSAGVGVSFATLGLQYASAKFVASNYDPTQPRWSAARATMNLTLIFSIAVTLVYAALSPFLSSYFMKSSDYTWLFLLGGLWLFTSAIQSVLLGILQGLKMYSLIAKMLLVTRFAVVAISLGVLYVDRNVGVAIASWVAYYLVLIIWTAMIARRGGVSVFARGEKKEKEEEGEGRKRGGSSYSTIMRYSLPLGIAALMFIIASTSQVFVIGGYMNPVSIGVFNAAVTISAVLGLVLVTPLTTALFPEVASSSNQKDEVSQGLRLAFRFLFLAVLPASFFVAAVSNQLVSLFTGGGGYLEGSAPLAIIGIFYLFPAMQLVVYSVLQATGKTNQVLVVGGVSAATGVAASLLLVPTLKLDGAALSTSLVGLVGTVVAMYFAKEYLGQVTDRKNLMFYGKSLVASAIPLVVLYFLSRLYFSHGLLTLIPYFLIGALLYLGLLKVFKLLSDEDRSYLEHLLPRKAKRILSYI